jgi:hypothetical protein
MKKKITIKKQDIPSVEGICDCDDINRDQVCRHLIKMCPFPFCTFRPNKYARPGTITRKNTRTSFSHFDHDDGADNVPSHRYSARASGTIQTYYGWSTKYKKTFIGQCGIEYWNNEESVYLDAYRNRIRIQFRGKNGTIVQPLEDLKWIACNINRDNHGIITNMDEIIATIQKYKILA